MYLLYVVFVFVSASGGGALKDSGAVCFSQQWRKPAGALVSSYPLHLIIFQSRCNQHILVAWWL